MSAIFPIENRRQLHLSILKSYENVQFTIQCSRITCIFHVRQHVLNVVVEYLDWTLQQQQQQQYVQSTKSLN